MANKIKDYILKISNGNDKKIKIIVAIGLIGIILISTSDFFDNDKSKKTNDTNTFDYVEYNKTLESKLTDIMSSIDGVGRCNVMITLENSAESIYATDNEIKTDNNSLNKKDEYVLYNTDNGETPVLLKEKLPRVQGVTVICDGGDDNKIKEKIVEAVTALFNISSSRVSVSKLKT